MDARQSLRKAATQGRQARHPLAALNFAPSGCGTKTNFKAATKAAKSVPGRSEKVSGTFVDPEGFSRVPNRQPLTLNRSINI
jgi:hypothetical protein